MKHPHLPQYFAIKRDENNPLWEEYKSFVRSNVGDEFDKYFSGWEYIGFNGNDHFNGFVGTIDLAFSFRERDVRIVTLSEWKNAIDKTEGMKETEFKPGEYCRFPSYEIQSMIDLLQENKYKVVQYPDVSDCEFIVFENGEFIPNQTKSFGTELTREQFMFKATRGKGVKPEFDSTKPMEISMNGLNWFPVSHYVGKDSAGLYWAECPSFDLKGWVCLRNTPEPFHAGMLKHGEHMTIESSNVNYDGMTVVLSDDILVCVTTGFRFGNKYDKSSLKGRRVKVNITTEEI